MQALRVEQDGDLLRVTMARPERRNAFDAELIAELTEAFGTVGDDVRAVVLAGEGQSFSAGADVDWMRSSIELSYEENVADARRLRKMLETIDSCPAPVVARVHGHALGGGCGLVACADIVVAAPDAVFAFAEVKLGIIPAVISPFALAKIGPSAARRYFVTGERFDAATALRIGLVHEVVEPGAVEQRAHALATTMAARARVSLVGGKQMVARAVAGRLDEDAEVHAAYERSWTSAEYAEGVAAFLGKRTPDFRAARAGEDGRHDVT